MVFQLTLSSTLTGYTNITTTHQSAYNASTLWPTCRHRTRYIWRSR